jgi:hypothetical protein
VQHADRLAERRKELPHRGGRGEEALGPYAVDELEQPDGPTAELPAPLEEADWRPRRHAAAPREALRVPGGAELPHIGVVAGDLEKNRAVLERDHPVLVAVAPLDAPRCAEHGFGQQRCGDDRDDLGLWPLRVLHRSNLPVARPWF